MKFMNRLALAAVCATLFSSAAFAHTTILFNVFLPQRFYMHASFVKWAHEVDRATDGRVTVKIPEASVAPPPGQWNAVRGGVVDGALIFNSFAPMSVKTLQTFGQLPFLVGSDFTAANVAYWRTYKKYFASHERTPGIKIIGLFLSSGGQMYSLTDKPITTMAELKTRKMWALPGASSNILKALGVAFVSGPAVRLQQLFSHHVANGAFGISDDGMVSFQGAPYIKSQTIFPRGVVTPSFSVFLSKQKWDSLSKPDRSALMSVSGESLARQLGEAGAASNARGRATMQKEGVVFLHASKSFAAAVEKPAAGMYRQWIKRARAEGVDSRAALDYFRAQQKQLSKG